MKNKKISDVLFAVWTGLAIWIVGGFLLFTNVVGGSADYTEAGRYFLSNHGVIKEPTASIYHACRVWETVFWITFPTYVAGCFLLVLVESRKQKKSTKPAQSHKKGA